MGRIQQQVFDFLKDIGRGTIYAVAGELTPFANGFNNARFISQLLFVVEGQEDEYVPVAFKEWKDAGLTRYAIEKARYFFYSMGILDYCVKKDRRGNPTAHYKLNFKALMSELKKFFKNAKSVILSSYAETIKSKRGQAKNVMPTNAKPHIKEMYMDKSVYRQSEKDRKQSLRDKYDTFYL